MIPSPARCWRPIRTTCSVLDTVVTWILEPTAEGGTRLRLVHDGFPIVVQQPATTPVRETTNARLTCANDNARSLKWAA